MGLYIQILGVAITNILGYVMEEGTGQSKKEPLLPVIRKSLECLHSSICEALHSLCILPSQPLSIFSGYSCDSS